MTRPYIDFLDKNNAREIFKLIKNCGIIEMFYLLKGRKVDLV